MQVQRQYSFQSMVSIGPPQRRPSVRATSAPAALSTPSERRDSTRMPSVLGESRESCRLNNTQPHSNKPQCYIEEYITSYLAKAPRSPTTRSMAHIHRIFPPRRRSEGSWLRPRREWACTRSLLRSVYAASVLVCRGKPRKCDTSTIAVL